MVQNFKPVLAYIGSTSELKKYMGPVKELLVSRLMRQLAQVFDTVKIDYFTSLIAGLDIHFYNIEKLAVLAVKDRQFSVRIDHQTSSLLFTGEGLEAQRLKNQLSSLAKGLAVVAEKIQPGRDRMEMEEEKKLFFEKVLARMEENHGEVLKRKGIIEQRKEAFERQQMLKQRELQRLRLQEEAARKAREKARIEEEQQRRADEAKKREEDKIKFETNRELMEQHNIDITTDELQTLNQKELIKKAQEQARKRKEKLSKLQQH